MARKNARLQSQCAHLSPDSASEYRYNVRGKDAMTECAAAMNPSPFHQRMRSTMLLAAIVGTFGGAVAQEASAPRLPDMNAYGCASMTSTTAATMRHIGQVIQGTYNEWQEYYIDVQGQPRLACISLLRPTTRPLSDEEARTFLLGSFAVGAPTAAAAAEQRQSAPESAEPANVQAEPIKRVRKPTIGSPSGERAQGAELPPLPAIKSFGGAPKPSPTPEKERNSGLLVPPAIVPWGKYEPPQAVGVEDREQITATQSYPWNTLAYLSVTYPSGTSFRCSATLVSPHVVLTAGHCIHNNQRGGYVTSVRVYPGQTQESPTDNTPVRPYGFKSDVAFLQTTSQWVQISGEDSYLIGDYRHDFAAIEFSTPFTHTSTFMPVLYSSTSPAVTSAGYPAQVNNISTFALYGDGGNETQDSLSDLRAEHVREFAVDASGGNSGGPFIYADPGTGQSYLVGSLSYAEDTGDQSGGPWYNSWNQSLISGWVSWTPGSPATGSVAGLRVASVFSSERPGLLSFLRFYNAGTSAGSVEVTLADYATGAVLATWNSPTLNARSARQFAISQIEAEASATFTKPLVYSISVRPTFSGTFQNVLLRTVEGTFTNVSTCDTPAALTTTLTNVHSSLLSDGYPSAVVIHNTGASATSLLLSIFHAQDGLFLGNYQTGVIQANGQLILPVSAIEAGANISPRTVRYHYNIRSITTFTGYMQHLVNNQAVGVTADMTGSCALSP
jgi:V8-like Glu-specific endopeptidase